MNNYKLYYMNDDKKILDLMNPSYASKMYKIRPTARLNLDGSRSTHLMAWDGDRAAFPTIFPKDPLNVTSNPKDWISGLTEDEAFEIARQRGEVFYFDNPEQAKKFAEGSWKNRSFGNIKL